MSGVLDEWCVDWRCKGFPPVADGVPVARIGDANWQLHRDFTTPVAVLKESALAHNLERMREYCDEHDVRIAPHGKTTMSPELVHRQMDHGAWGITAATAWQARVFLELGVRRVLIANECHDPVGLRWIAEYMRDNPDREVHCFVDSVAAVAAMRDVVSGIARIPVLVEVGIEGGRAGARGVDPALEVGLAAAAADELELVGVAGFEGVIGAERTPAVVGSVRRFLGQIRSTGESLMQAGAFSPDRPVILSAGGSAFFDQVADVLASDRGAYPRATEIVIRSGCYVTHDHAVYAAASPFRGGGEGDFRPAMEVWARVLSVPEPGLAIIDAGKRDVSTDSSMPVVLQRMRDGRPDEVTGAVVERCNDQHGYVRFNGEAGARGALRVGDLVALGISHPCTTFDKWRVLPVVDDAYRVLSAVRTFF